MLFPKFTCYGAHPLICAAVKRTVRRRCVFLAAAVLLTAAFVISALSCARRAETVSPCGRILPAVLLCALIVCGFGSVQERRLTARALEDLQRLSAELRSAEENADTASHARAVFLRSISHDIHTPINAIIGFTRLALREDVSPCVRDSLEKIDVSAHSLLSLIGNAVDMSQLESGVAEIFCGSLDIEALADGCADTVRGQLIGREIEFTQDINITHRRVFGDGKRIRQIITNVLDNSVKFTPDGGTIEYSVTELPGGSDGADYRFSVRDTGCGMSPDFLGHVFEAFAQENGGARTVYGGSGLGMAISKSLLDLMDGSVTVKSEPGEGSVFTVTIPLKFDGSPHDAADAAVSLDGVRVLLAEDNELNMELACEALEDAGITVTPAENGQIAVDIFALSPPGTFDVILMDIMMPVMDGLTAARTIRALSRPDARTVPILAITASTFEEDIRKSRDAGMNAHLTKPLDIAHVLGTISGFTSGRRG